MNVAPLGNSLDCGLHADLRQLIGIGVLLWPPNAYLAVLIVLLIKNRRRTELTTLGSARWANEASLKQSGMFGASTGLILGRTRRTPIVWQRLTGQRGPIVRLPQAVHAAVYAPTGASKGVSLVASYFLASKEPAVVLDFKGELATLTANHRESLR